MRAVFHDAYMRHQAKMSYAAMQHMLINAPRLSWIYVYVFWDSVFLYLISAALIHRRHPPLHVMHVLC